MAVQERSSKRELERQFKAALFERTVTQPAKISAALIAEYQTQLPDKQLLLAKLQEFYSLDTTEE